MKPPVLSCDEIDSLLDQFNPAVRDHDGMFFAIEIANAQRDADVEWYDLLRNKDADQCCQAIADARQEARQDTAKEIFEEIEEEYGIYTDMGLRYIEIYKEYWQSLKSKYTGGLNGK